RTSPKSWGALCLGMLLMSAASSSARADGWWRFASNDDSTTSTGTTDTSTGTTGTTAAQTTTYYDCPPESRWRSFWRRGSGRYRYGNRGATLNYQPVDQAYCDPRDRLLYSAQGYNVPVTVPLAPVCRTYNYGWGIPSARLTRAGAYSQWYPDVAFTQTRGRLPGGVYPMVYQPTETTPAAGRFHDVST